MFHFVFICIIIKINHLYLHLTFVYFPDGYIVILPKFCNLLSLLQLSETLLISAVYTQCPSTLNLCRDFAMVLFSNVFNHQT